MVVAANGPAFCAGHDLSELLQSSEATLQEIFTHCSQAMMQFRRLPQPVIARVQGLATAAGCQLVAACDLAIAADSATSCDARCENWPVLNDAHGAVGSHQAIRN